jgi:hypothetical protein
MSALLWEFIALAYAPLGAHGALVDGPAVRVARFDETGMTLAA